MSKYLSVTTSYGYQLAEIKILIQTSTITNSLYESFVTIVNLLLD